MLPISAKDIVRFTPDGAGDDDPRPVYRLAVPTVRDRAAVLREITEEGLVFVDDARLHALVREGIGAIVEDSQRAELLKVVDDFEAAGRGGGEPGADIRDEYAQLERFMLDNYQPYRKATAQRFEFLSVAPYVLAGRFLRGWEGVAPEFTRVAGRVPEDRLERLPGGHLLEIMGKIYTLMTPDGATRKNSESPSRSRKGRKSSRRD